MGCPTAGKVMPNLAKFSSGVWANVRRQRDKARKRRVFFMMIVVLVRMNNTQILFKIIRYSSTLLGLSIYSDVFMAVWTNFWFQNLKTYLCFYIGYHIVKYK